VVCVWNCNRHDITVGKNIRKNVNTVLVLDIGTSAYKCGIVKVDGNKLIYSATEQFKISCPKEERCEVDFTRCWAYAARVLKKVVKEANRIEAKVEAVLLTSQAQTFAPVDKKFNPLSGGIVWLDSRAEDESVILNEKLPDFCLSAGFDSPKPVLYISKLMWLKRNYPQLFKKTMFFPHINEYIGYQLTRKFYTDYTNFGMSGIMDIRTKKFNRKVLKILGLKQPQVPLLYPACGKGFPVKQSVAQKLGLKSIPLVYYCGNDQSSSASGAGVTHVGDVSINFGTAMVVYTLTPQPLNEVGETQIIGVSPIDDKYFVISLESQFGSVIDKFKNTYFPELSYNDVYRMFYGKHPGLPHSDSSGDIIKIVGDTVVFDGMRTNPYIAGELLIHHFINRVKCHLREISHCVNISKLYVSGGATRSEVWINILRETLPYDIVVAAGQRDSALIGAAKIYSNTLVV